MKTAAVMRTTPGEFEIETVDLNGPQQDELLIRVAAAGVRSSDDHFAQGDFTVGPHTAGAEAGDHVALVRIPACGGAAVIAGLGDVFEVTSPEPRFLTTPTYREG